MITQQRTRAGTYLAHTYTHTETCTTLHGRKAGNLKKKKKTMLHVTFILKTIFKEAICVKQSLGKFSQTCYA